MYNYGGTKNNIDIYRELMSVKYMMTTILNNQNNILYYLESKTQAIFSLLSPEQIKKIKNTVAYKDTIDFDKFSLSARYYNALVNRFTADSVVNACIILDNYLKDNLNKNYSQKEINKKIKELITQEYSKQTTNAELVKLIKLANQVDYKLIDNETLARQYINGIPFYMQSIDEGCKYLKEKFNI